MNGYICFYKGERTEVHAATTMLARDKAAVKFRVKPNRHHDITVMLAEKGGKTVTHNADF